MAEIAKTQISSNQLRGSKQLSAVLRQAVGVMLRSAKRVGWTNVEHEDDLQEIFDVELKLVPNRDHNFLTSYEGVLIETPKDSLLLRISRHGEVRIPLEAVVFSTVKQINEEGIVIVDLRKFPDSRQPFLWELKKQQAEIAPKITNPRTQLVNCEEFPTLK